MITGGAGFLGINLVRYFLQRDWQVTSLDVADFDYPERDRVRIVTGDIRDTKKVVQATEGADLVVHCAAALPLYSREDIFTTDVDGTRNVLEAARQAGIKRIVHVSSTAVYGVPDHHPIYEDDKKIGVGPYGEAKIKAEEVCLEYRQKGMCVPILRPKSFIGPERLGVFAMLYDWAKDGKGFPIIGKGNNRYQLLDVEDLCEAIYIVSTRDENIVNDTFNIGAKEYRTFKEDFQAVLDHAGFGKKIKAFPAGPVIVALKILEALKLSPLYKWVYETACQESFVSVEKAEKVLGFTPKYSNQDALIRNFQWYLDNVDTFSGQSGISHRVPWSQGILRVAKWFF
jgi:nucleoside-diphosphate-sugar epimerase